MSTSRVKPEKKPRRSAGIWGFTSKRVDWRGVIYLALLVGAAVLVVTRWSELSSIWRDHALTFAAVTFLMVVGILIQGRNFKSFLPSTGLGLWEMTRIWAFGALANYLGPFQPGVAVRVALLARAGVPVVESSIATARQTFASLWLALPVLGVSLAVLDPIAMALPAAGLLGLFVLVAFALPIVRAVVARGLALIRVGYLVPHIEAAIELPTLGSALGVLSQYALSAIVFYFSYREFGVEVSMPTALSLSCAVSASSLVAILPGNFGILEALLTLVGRVNELPVDQALALALLYRGAHVVGAFAIAATGLRRRS